MRGQHYCLKHLGFGLNVAPLIMKTVVRTIVEQDEAIGRVVLPYVDDLLVDRDAVSAERVVEDFARYGLAYEPPQRAANRARLLDLHVSAHAGGLPWCHDNPKAVPSETLIRKALFA